MDILQSYPYAPLNEVLRYTLLGVSHIIWNGGRGSRLVHVPPHSVKGSAPML